MSLSSHHLAEDHQRMARQRGWQVINQVCRQKWKGIQAHEMLTLDGWGCTFLMSQAQGNEEQYGVVMRSVEHVECIMEEGATHPDSFYETYQKWQQRMRNR